ncbi:MAG: hypothetical protein V4691_04095 [Pseudomonadota bacterium]
MTEAVSGNTTISTGSTSSVDVRSEAFKTAYMKIAAEDGGKDNSRIDSQSGYRKLIELMGGERKKEIQNGKSVPISRVALPSGAKFEDGSQFQNNSLTTGDLRTGSGGSSKPTGYAGDGYSYDQFLSKYGAKEEKENAITDDKKETTRKTSITTDDVDEGDTELPKNAKFTSGKLNITPELLADKNISPNGKITTATFIKLMDKQGILDDVVAKINEGRKAPVEVNKNFGGVAEIFDRKQNNISLQPITKEQLIAGLGPDGKGTGLDDKVFRPVILSLGPEITNLFTQGMAKNENAENNSLDKFLTVAFQDIPGGTWKDGSGIALDKLIVASEAGKKAIQASQAERQKQQQTTSTNVSGTLKTLGNGKTANVSGTLTTSSSNTGGRTRPDDDNIYSQ